MGLISLVLSLLLHGVLGRISRTVAHLIWQATIESYQHILPKLCKRNVIRALAGRHASDIAISVFVRIAVR